MQLRGTRGGILEGVGDPLSFRDWKPMSLPGCPHRPSRRSRKRIADRAASFRRIDPLRESKDRSTEPIAMRSGGRSVRVIGGLENESAAAVLADFRMRRGPWKGNREVREPGISQDFRGGRDRFFRESAIRPPNAMRECWTPDRHRADGGKRMPRRTAMAAAPHAPTRRRTTCARGCGGIRWSPARSRNDRSPRFPDCEFSIVPDSRKLRQFSQGREIVAPDFGTQRQPRFPISPPVDLLDELFHPAKRMNAQNGRKPLPASVIRRWRIAGESRETDGWPGFT